MRPRRQLRRPEVLPPEVRLEKGQNTVCQTIYWLGWVFSPPPPPPPPSPHRDLRLPVLSRPLRRGEITSMPLSRCAAPIAQVGRL